MVRFGSLATFACFRDVRYSPNSDRSADIPKASLSAKSRHSLARRFVPEAQVKSVHSITLSARAARLAGISTPIAFAAFRLIISSNLAGCSTGMSAGLAPRKTEAASAGDRALKNPITGASRQPDHRDGSNDGQHLSHLRSRGDKDIALAWRRRSSRVNRPEV